MKFFRQIGLTFGVLVLTLCGLGVLGYMSFQGPIRQEKARLFKKENRQTFKEALSHTLPMQLAAYLQRVGADQNRNSAQVKFQQRGKIWNSPEQEALTFSAREHISAYHPGFIWYANLFPVYARDKFLDNNGEMWVNMMGLGNIHRSSSPEVDQGSLMRYLGELVWAPSGFRDEKIQWDSTLTK
ncbi:MAG: DUF6544 family protein, partial [Bacteroidota bacterium]